MFGEEYNQLKLKNPCVATHRIVSQQVSNQGEGPRGSFLHTLTIRETSRVQVKFPKAEIFPKAKYFIYVLPLEVIPHSVFDCVVIHAPICYFSRVHLGAKI